MPTFALRPGSQTKACTMAENVLVGEDKRGVCPDLPWEVTELHPDYTQRRWFGLATIPITYDSRPPDLPLA